MIVVTGGAGFIGSNIVRALNQQGETDILIVDNLGKSAKYLNLNKLKFSDYIDKVEFIENLPAILEGRNVKAIIHQGACSATTELDGNYLISNNYEYSKTLLHYCLDHKISFIYASSASVYGNGDNGFTEKSECEYALNGYAFSKLIFDNYVRRVVFDSKAVKDNSFSVVGLRYFNVYGYQENHKGSMSSVPFHFFQQSKSGGEIKIFEGSEDFYRDFIFIEDVVNVVMHFYKNPAQGIFNCGTGIERSFGQMANVFTSIDPSCKIVKIPFPDHLKGKYQAFTKADVAALRGAGYKAAFLTLEEGIKKYHAMLEKSNGLFV